MKARKNQSSAAGPRGLGTRIPADSAFGLLNKGYHLSRQIACTFHPEAIEGLGRVQARAVQNPERGGDAGTSLLMPERPPIIANLPMREN